MIPRLPSATFSLALTITALLGAASAAPVVAATATVAYTIEKHGQQVTVKDEAGKVLLTCHAATPTLRALVAAQVVATASKTVGASFTLEDKNGLRLWSTQVAPPPELGSAKTMQYGVVWNSDVAGSRFAFTFSTDPTTIHDPVKAASMVCVLGADGHLVSMKGGDTGGTQVNAVVKPNGMSMTDSKGDVMKMAMTNKSASWEMNGKKVTAVAVKREGKEYLSFPWNGHRVFVQSGCTFLFSHSGDLTINGPVDTASK